MELKVNTIIDQEKCTGCGACLKVCLYRVISLENKKAVVTGQECYNCGHCAAACPAGAVAVSTLQPPVYQNFSVDNAWLPFGQGATPELVRLMGSLRSCRNFTGQPVNRAILEDLVNIATLAPSGSNQQEWSYTILDQRPQVKRLAGYTAGFIRWLNRVSRIKPLRNLAALLGSRDALQYYERYYNSYSAWLAEWDLSGRDFVFYGAPAAIIISIPRVIGTPAEDAMLASHNIRLAAHTMGLGTCLIGFSVKALRSWRPFATKMGIPRQEDVYAAIAIGWPDTSEKYARTIERRKITPRYLE